MKINECVIESFEKRIIAGDYSDTEASHRIVIGASGNQFRAVSVVLFSGGKVSQGAFLWGHLTFRQSWRLRKARNKHIEARGLRLQEDYCDRN